MQNRLEEVIKEKKNPTNSKNGRCNKQQRRNTRKYSDGTTVIIGASILNGIIQERLSNR